MILETVTVKRNGAKGYHIINKSDFVEGVHELYDADAKPAQKKPKKAADAANEAD